MLRIRRAVPADLDELILLFAAHASYEGAEFNPGNTFKKDLASLIFKQTTMLCWVVEKDQEILGYATCIEQYATWSAKKYLYLDCLYLTEQIRGQGIGSKIMDTIVAALKQRALTEIQWQTPASNQPAIQFYLGLGAKELPKSRFIWTP